VSKIKVHIRKNHSSALDELRLSNTTHQIIFHDSVGKTPKHLLLGKLNVDSVTHRIFLYIISRKTDFATVFSANIAHRYLKEAERGILTYNRRIPPLCTHVKNSPLGAGNLRLVFNCLDQ